MPHSFYESIASDLASIRAEGLWKEERPLGSPQGAAITVAGRQAKSLNFCANNYLGLASHERVIDASIEAARRWGAGLASVRFICGTQEIHRELERATADFLGYEDTISFAAAFDANGGVFEPLVGEADAIVSDSLNHASIIDGIRLSKAQRYRFANGDMESLEKSLREARSAGTRHVLIATDGVFSMDGTIADLGSVSALAKRYDALVMVDDCHSTGVLGERGRGTASFRNVEGQVDILTGTYGKALGGAMGGFIAARRDVVDLLRQRARPYLFSNALAPALCGAAIAALGIAGSAQGDALRERLFNNARRFRSLMAAAEFDLLPGQHPIVPVMVRDAVKAQRLASRLLEAGVYVTAFSYPVVPKGLARIRVQLSAAHNPDQIDMAVAAFIQARDEVEAGQ